MNIEGIIIAIVIFIVGIFIGLSDWFNELMEDITIFILRNEKNDKT